MLVAAAFVPASPLLLSSVHKHAEQEAGATLRSLRYLADLWYAQGITTLCIVSGSRFAYDDAIAIDVNDPYHIDLEEVGDLSKGETFHPNMKLIDALQRQARKQHLPITLTSDPLLPLGSAAALKLFTKHRPSMRIVPIIPARQGSVKMHYQMGGLLKSLIEEVHERVGLIATEDLPLHEVRDIETILQEKSIASFFSFSEDSNKKPHLPLAVLLGAQEHSRNRTEILSLESPFDVGYLVAHVT